MIALPYRVTNQSNKHEALTQSYYPWLSPLPTTIPNEATNLSVMLVMETVPFPAGLQGELDYTKGGMEHHSFSGIGTCFPVAAYLITCTEGDKSE